MENVSYLEGLLAKKQAEYLHKKDHVLIDF